MEVGSANNYSLGSTHMAALTSACGQILGIGLRVITAGALC